MIIPILYGRLNSSLKVFFLAIAFASVSTYAQDIKFEQYGINEGLSQNTVSCILQDKKGFMWFGTRDGLNKYDGYKFTIYKRSLQNKNSITANDIKAIAEDHDGNLWIATWAGGLNVFHTNEEKFTHYVNTPGDPTSIASNYIRSLLFDSDGKLWIGTGENGLDLYDPLKNNFTHFVYDKNNSESLSDNTVTALLEDDQKNLWVGTIHGGLNLFNKERKSFTRFLNDITDPHTIAHNNIQFIHQDSKNRLWIGTYGGGLCLLNRGSSAFTTIQAKDENQKKETGKDALLSMTEDSNGNLWIGTENQGLRFFNPDKNAIINYYHYDNDNTSIGSNSITSLYKDLKGNIWIGTFQGGINMINIDVQKFRHYKHRQSTNSISSNTITSLYEDGLENLWIGTDGGGLNLLNRNTGRFTIFKHDLKNKNSLASNHILSICEDTQHKIWMGTWGEGISIYDPKTKNFRQYQQDLRNPKSISSNYAFYIFRDKKQRMWIGTYGNGLNLYHSDTDNFSRYVHDEKDKTSISTNYILTIFEDKDGRLWIGTDGGGLNYFDEKEGKFTTFKYNESPGNITNNIINSICEDQAGFLWLGTNFGLNKFNPTTKTMVARYFSEQGLPSDVVTGILPDKSNDLWIGTAKGLSKFTHAKNSFKNFTLSDGIQGNEFRAQCLGKNGLMYFGGKNGFNEFSPDTIASLPFDPPLVFTGFQIFNKEVPISREASDTYSLQASINETRGMLLTYHESVITFEFASLNYTGIEKKQYRYWLEGFDKEWNYIGSKNNVTYTNLNPGHYTLHVNGLTNDGKWSTGKAQINLTITPPFWRTWWFKLFCLLLLTTIIALSFYIRFASVKKRNKQLKEEVEKRTSELMEANYSLIESNEEVKTQNEKLEDLNLETLRKSDKILQQQEKIILQNQELEETVHKLEKTNKTKDRFFSILAHDLKNPVSALTGITDVLKTTLERLNKEEVHSYVNNINQSSHAVHKLLKNLLDWAKTHTQDIPYTPVTIRINDVVLKNLSLMEQQLREKSIKLETQIDPSHCAYADFYMVDTIVRNILNNSIKFTSKHGKISIVSQVSETTVSLIITDNGVGMTDDKIQNLFQTDKKDLSLGTHGETGTGLGLIITKEFLEVNHGDIVVTSEPGNGSQFSIQLPRAVSVESNSETEKYDLIQERGPTKIFSVDQLPDDKISKIKGKRILIVDDNKEIRAFLRLLLSSTCEIFEAEDGVQGLDVAIQFQPVLIISDMIMPRMNGTEFCKQIKNNTITSHIPVILLTSQTEDEHQLSGYEAGADVYLTKPVKPDILFQVIHNIVLRQERIHQKYATSKEIYPDELSFNKLDEEFLTKVVAYIEEHLSTSLDHKKLCDLTAMSRSLLYLKIKTLTGHGVHDLIKSIRLKKGLQLLLEGRLNITQVTFEVGFTTPSHFSKSFMKQYGVSPSEYISNLKKKINKA